MEEMIGSYGPQKDAHVKIVSTPLLHLFICDANGHSVHKFAADEAPSGMIARGTYSVRSKIVDDDATVHLDLEWSKSSPASRLRALTLPCRIGFKISRDW